MRYYRWRKAFLLISHIPTDLSKFTLHCYNRTSVIRGFWGQNLVRPSYMKYSKTSIIHTSIIRGFWDQNLVRPSTADNRGLTVYQYPKDITWLHKIFLFLRYETLSSNLNDLIMKNDSVSDSLDKLKGEFIRMTTKYKEETMGYTNTIADLTVIVASFEALYPAVSLSSNKERYHLCDSWEDICGRAWFLQNDIIHIRYLPKTKKFGCVGEET